MQIIIKSNLELIFQKTNGFISKKVVLICSILKIAQNIFREILNFIYLK